MGSLLRVAKSFSALGLAAFLFAGMSFAGLDAVMPLEPLVYTGAMHSAGSDRSMLARMFIIPGGNNGPFEAHLILYHGSFDSREYVPIIFDKVDRQEDGSYLLTSMRMTGGGMAIRHPVVEIGVPGDTILEGVFDSGRQTRAGVLKLAKGWELSPDTFLGRRVVPSFEGRYFGNCMGGPHSDMLTGLELYSTRSQIEDILIMPGVDTAVEANVYGGGTLCQDVSGLGQDKDLSCMGFSSGHYDLYSGKLNLFINPSWKWTCDFDEVNDTITCDTPRFGHRCEMYRLRDREMMLNDTTGRAPYGLADTDPQMAKIKNDLRAKDPASQKDAPPIKCMDLRKQLFGLLHHQYTGLYERVAMDLVVIEVEPGICKISGFIAQYFEKIKNLANEPITHVVETMKYDVKEDVFRIASGPMGDAVLILKREGLHFSGYWYSRLFGLVGRVEFGEGIDFSDIPEEAFVPAIAGNYDSQPQNNVRVHRTLALSTATDSADSRSFNPIRQLPTSGLLKTEVISPDGDGYGLQTTAITRNLVYDYFTGRVTFETGTAQFYGPVLYRGLNLRMITTNEGARFMPFGLHWDYERVRNSRSQ